MSDHRSTDPESSRWAAVGNLPRRPTDKRNVIAELVKAGDQGMTDFELAHALGKQQTSIGKRRGELVEAKMVEWAGTWRKAPSGARARVWRIAR